MMEWTWPSVIGTVIGVSIGSSVYPLLNLIERRHGEGLALFVCICILAACVLFVAYKVGTP